MKPRRASAGQRVARRSYLRSGRLLPSTARRLRSRAMILKPGNAVAWHSTRQREELLLGVAGSVRIDYGAGRPRSLTMAAGQCVFIPPGTPHRVVNASSTAAQYIYVVG
jgi:mannose-6-phosphate isomerase-like protein (cupin superfamily)